MTIAIVHSISSVAMAQSDVQRICEKTGLKVLLLKARDQTANRALIQSAELGSPKLSQFLKSVNKESAETSALEWAARGGVEKFIPKSKSKTIFLKYAERSQKLTDSVGYRAAVIAMIDQYVPRHLNKLKWFLDGNEPWIESTQLRPEAGEDLGEDYGAILRSETSKSGREKLEIVFSNNTSEPLPYLISLIVHELQHASSHKERRAIEGHREQTVAGLIDEAKAYDLQMQTCIALIEKDPQLFCNWMYVTWAYGDLVVPLSWSLASMESEMKRGRYIYDYAKIGRYKSETYLLNDDKSDLRLDIKQKIAALKLKYVR